MNLGDYLFHEITKRHKCSIQKSLYDETYKIKLYVALRNIDISVIFGLDAVDLRMVDISEYLKKDELRSLYGTLDKVFNDTSTWDILDYKRLAMSTEEIERPFLIIGWLDLKLTFIEFLTIFRGLHHFFNSDESKK